MSTKNDLLNILYDIKNGKTTPEEAVERLTYKDLGFARVDTSRSFRHSVGEVIYGESKTGEQIAKIAKTLLSNGEDSVLITRMDSDKADYVASQVEIEYDNISRAAIAGRAPQPKGKSDVLVCCAGTSDLYCAQEAMMTLKAFGCRAKLLCDVGVAGIHRLLDHADEISNARVIIAVAGMEGALASVLGGLAGCPVIAVPTSVGYGASFEGVAALLSMLNSCSGNVSVVNIDNGFGAAYIANMINNQE